MAEEKKKKKGILAKLFGAKKSCCCNMKIEEVPETEPPQAPNPSKKSSCCDAEGVKQGKNYRTLQLSLPGWAQPSLGEGLALLHGFLP
jgi:hypothetical protein